MVRAPLRLYADECISGHLVAGLRSRGIDIMTAAEEGLLGAEDPQQLARAVTINRTLVTSDEDHLRLVNQLLQDGQDFPGLIFILPRTSVGAALRSIVALAETTEAPALRNRIEWISTSGRG